MNGAKGQGKSGIAAGGMLAGAVMLLALPSAVLAFSSRFETSVPETAPLVSETDASVALARPASVRSLAKGKLFLFTPANTPSRPDRSITVAVRVNERAAEAISVRGVRGSRQPLAQSAAPATAQIAPTAFNLGVARGYKNLTQSLVPSSQSRKSVAEMGALDNFAIRPGIKPDESRFAPRISLDETQGAGRAPRTFAGNADDQVDVGGSYRVTKNLDVTAGVRYSRERERLLPLTDGKQDSQAVYVGTQFAF